MYWTEKHTEGVEELTRAMPDAMRRSLEAEAAHLFVQMKILGLAPDLPDTIAGVTREQAAKLLQLAINVRATSDLLRLIALPAE